MSSSRQRERRSRSLGLDDQSTADECIDETSDLSQWPVELLHCVLRQLLRLSVVAVRYGVAADDSRAAQSAHAAGLVTNQREHRMCCA